MSSRTHFSRFTALGNNGKVEAPSTDTHVLNASPYTDEIRLSLYSFRTLLLLITV